MSNLLYGIGWDPQMTRVDIEMEMIRRGGYIQNRMGTKLGIGLFGHYKALITELWPDDDHHRWSDLGLKAIVENEIVVFMGCADSNKTYLMSRFVLCDWWTFADNTLWMVSSTEMRGAELRIWGKLKELFNRARARHPWLPGTILESKHAFTTEEISDDGSEARLMTKGIVFIPCKSNNRWVGMGSYAGIKPTKNGRLGHAGDEVSTMETSFLDAYSNWYGKQNFKGIMSGNPIEQDDPLCTAGEPVEGWENWHDSGKTQEWRSRFYGAWVVAYDGRDSPNLDYPKEEPTRFPYMIGHKKLDAVEKSLGKDSPLWWMQCVGKPMMGVGKLKVITKQLCEQGKAFDEVVWEGSETIQVAACDAAYGGVGGDRCVIGRGEFGRDVAGNIVLCLYPPQLVPVSIKLPEIPEDQIARFCRTWCEGFGIAPENFFFDARATLAVAYARLWSPNVNAVDFGGSATPRPVSMDEYVWDGDTRTRRLKRANEHYSKFVTELWFSVRYAVLGQQIRQLSKEVAEEGYKRLWRFTKGNPPRIEVETKEEMKLRTTRSPDLFDMTVTLVEGARRLGFEIRNLKEGSVDESEQDGWLERELNKYRAAVKKSELNYSQ